MKAALLSLPLLLTLAGCQTLGLSTLDLSTLNPANWWADAPVEAPRPTLASLQPAALDLPEPPTASVSLAQVIDSYQALLPLVTDATRQQAVQHRLADLQFMQAEDQMAGTVQGHLSEAITNYQALLRQHPDAAGRDQMYYQLGKAYELSGNRAAHLATLDALAQAYPQSPYWIETQFRRGDIRFSEGQYAAALQAFDAVINADPASHEKTAFLANAYYMKGWSLFKLSDYPAALDSFTQVLDLLLPQDQQLQVAEKNQTLVEDLFRVMGLSFSYLGGADSLQALFERTGPKAYDVLVYDRYSQLLIEKEQYSDAIAVLTAYTQTHPFSQWAPQYQMRIMAILQQGGFHQDIPVRKAAFVRQYGINSAYWAQAQQAGEADLKLRYVKTQLEQLLPELANRHYVQAQNSTAPKAAPGARSEQDHYAKAADLYAEFVATFPTHPKTPELLFLLGETRYKLQQWPQAIAAFERVAYDFPADQRAAEAAYAAILAYTEAAKTREQLPETMRLAQQARQQASRLRFVDTFAADPRAPDVLIAAAQYANSQQAHEEVIRLTQRIVDWQPAPTAKRRMDARSMQAHSLYALQRYPEAERAWQTLLAQLPQGDPQAQAIADNLAAAVYRQAETALAAGNKAAAVQAFLRVGRVAPSARLAGNAQFDAANYLIELADWPNAIQVITDFRQRYPQHEGHQTLTGKLALAYRESGQWTLAADESMRMFQQTDDPQQKPAILLLAAGLYARGENHAKAIDAYRDYANRYPEPIQDYANAIFQLSALYAKTHDPVKQRFWLNKQMQLVEANAETADDDMRLHAATAAALFAEDARSAFDAIGLSLPLERSLSKKIAAMEKTIKAYQRTVKFAVARFSTQAGYQMASLYEQLGRDLMASERPAGLSDLELEQYELLLEEQAFPFEDNAIALHEKNARLSWSGLYDDWVKQSFTALQRLLPGRYHKPESTIGFSHALD